MAGALPAVVDQREKLTTRHQPIVSGFEQRSATLMGRELTLMTANMAHDLDSSAKAWLEGFDKETKPTKDALFQAHRNFTAFCAKMSAPAQTARDRCRDIIGRYQLQERRKAEAERLEREQIAREEAEAIRKAEVDARLAEAVHIEAVDPAMAEVMMQEAEELEQAPLARAVTVEPEPPSKVEGSNTRYELYGSISDLPAFLRWIVAGERWDVHRELFGEHGVSGMKALLKRMCTLMPGGVVYGLPPGVLAEIKPVTSNRSR